MMSRVIFLWFLFVAVLSASLAAKLQKKQQDEEDTPKTKRADCNKPLSGQWLNELDGHFLFECVGRRSIQSIYAVYNNAKRDRRFRVKCGFNKAARKCSWETNYANDWDKPLSFRCSHNGFINGIESIHRNKNDDRRFRFRCCNDAIRYETTDCITKGYINTWKGELNIAVNRDKGEYLVGLTSVHANKFQDRRWKFTYCKLDYIRR